MFLRFTIFKVLNCLAYQYQYRPKFYNWLPVFLGKVKLVSNYRYEPKFYYSLLLFFLLSFASLWHFSYMSLPSLLSDGLIFFGLSPSKKICIICFTESPLKMMKNAFYFILKALFVLKIFKFLLWLFGHVEKMAWLER